MTMAPGITISQAVVEVKGEITFKHMILLEEKLKIQRNNIPNPTNCGWMITERSRRTGHPAVSRDQDGFLDAATIAKQNASKEKILFTIFDKEEKGNFPKEITNLIQDENKSWIAVVHADGNGLGKVLNQISASLSGKSGDKVMSTYREFSSKLDEATKLAAKQAFEEVIEKEKTKKGFYRFIPVIVGGDDLTVIVAAKHAIEYTEKFLEYFEIESTKAYAVFFKQIGLNNVKGLTACAGVAFVKASYPFHYAVNAAEQLCGEAKKASKAIDQTNIPSSLSFFKIQGSFVNSIKENREQEQTCKDDYSFNYGPYFLNKRFDKPTINDLLNKTKLLMKGGPSSQLRQWVTERYESKESAAMLMDRTVQVMRLKNDKKNKEFIKEFDLENTDNDKSPIYDWLTLASVQK